MEDILYLTKGSSPTPRKLSMHNGSINTGDPAHTVQDSTMRSGVDKGREHTSQNNTVTRSNIASRFSNLDTKG